MRKYNMHRSNITAWVFILLGLLLLLNQFDILFFNRFNVALLGSILLGALLLNKGLHHPFRKGILGGSFFLLFALILILMKLGYIPINDLLGSGLVLIMLGLANIIYFFSFHQRVANIVFALLFSLLGLPFILGYYETLPGWMLEDYFFTYWPVVLILVGAGILLGGSHRKQQKLAKNI